MKETACGVGEVQGRLCHAHRCERCGEGKAERGRQWRAVLVRAVVRTGTMLVLTVMGVGMFTTALVAMMSAAVAGGMHQRLDVGLVVYFAITQLAQHRLRGGEGDAEQHEQGEQSAKQHAVPSRRSDRKGISQQ